MLFHIFSYTFWISSATDRTRSAENYMSLYMFCSWRLNMYTCIFFHMFSYTFWISSAMDRTRSAGNCVFSITFCSWGLKMLAVTLSRTCEATHRLHNYMTLQALVVFWRHTQQTWTHFVKLRRTSQHCHPQRPQNPLSETPWIRLGPPLDSLSGEPILRLK